MPAERRPLIDGIKPPSPPVDPEREREFLRGAKVRGGDTASGTSPAPATVAATPLSTRIRSDFAAAIKRASLERQLSGEKPNTVKDILEDAIEPWLKSRGYLD